MLSLIQMKFLTCTGHLYKLLHNGSTVLNSDPLIISSSGVLSNYRHFRARTVRCCASNDSFLRGVKSPCTTLPIVALDVEYIHFESAGEDIVVPGEICVVNTHDDVLYHSFCRPGSFWFKERSCVDLVEHSQYHKPVSSSVSSIYAVHR